MTVNIDMFGKDHWSTLAYCECCCTDNAGKGFGTLARNRMRCNKERHPLLSAGLSWSDNYSSCLKGIDVKDTPEQALEKGTRLRGHDDWDCLDDLEAAGLIEIISLINCAVKMTDKGNEVAAKLRAHKANGGRFIDFQP